jgi:hypothetical protein
MWPRDAAILAEWDAWWADAMAAGTAARHTFDLLCVLATFEATLVERVLPYCNGMSLYLIRRWTIDVLEGRTEGRQWLLDHGWWDAAVETKYLGRDRD